MDFTSAASRRARSLAAFCSSTATGGEVLTLRTGVVPSGHFVFE